MNDRKMMISGIVLTIAAVGQIVLAFVLYDPDGIVWLINLGWLVLMVSAVFGWLPIVTFRRKGKVEGRSYMHTTVLVDSGVYRIVRHPQYLAGILMNIALPMIAQHWLVIVPGVVAGVVTYLTTFDEEDRCIEKFGDAYRDYQERVPRVNFIRGIWRALF